MHSLLCERNPYMTGVVQFQAQQCLADDSVEVRSGIMTGGFIAHVHTIARYKCCSVNCGGSVAKESVYQQHFSRFCYQGASAALLTSINRNSSQPIPKYLANKRDVRVTHVLTVIRFFDNAAWPANGSICIYFRITNANEMLAAYLGPVVCDGHSPIFPKDCPSGMLVW